MDNNISDLMNKFSDLMGNSDQKNDQKQSTSSQDTKSSNSSFDFSKVSPEMLKGFASMFGSSHSSDGNKEAPNFDMETIMKMKSVMENINRKDDPRSNLLQSLKPYLKESRKSKVDQYIGLMNMSKVMGLFNNGGGKAK